MNAYSVYTTAKTFQLRPSDLVGIPDDTDHAYERFELDSAIGGLGRYIDNKLEEYTVPKKGSKESPKRKYKTVADVLRTVKDSSPKKVVVNELPLKEVAPTVEERTEFYRQRYKFRRRVR